MFVPIKGEDVYQCIDDTKLARRTNTPEDRNETQSDLDWLEKRVENNRMKPNRGNLGNRNQIRYRLGDTWVGDSMDSVTQEELWIQKE